MSLVFVFVFYRANNASNSFPCVSHSRGVTYTHSRINDSFKLIPYKVLQINESFESILYKANGPNVLNWFANQFK